MHKLNSNLLTFLDLSIYVHIVVLHTYLPSYAIYFHFPDWFFFRMYCFHCTVVKRQDFFIGYFVSYGSIFIPKLLVNVSRGVREVSTMAERKISSFPFELLPAFSLPLQSHSVLQQVSVLEKAMCAINTPVLPPGIGLA